MTSTQINILITENGFPRACDKPELIETHISWVILCNHFAYKIKKPVSLSFADFSTPEKRKYYCEKEIVLNRRLTEDIYVDVLPVVKTTAGFSVGGKGEIIDYAVRMNKVDRSRQMDLMLQQQMVTTGHIQQLAVRIATFHTSTCIVAGNRPEQISAAFNDLSTERDFLQQYMPREDGDIIEHSIKRSDAFLEKYRLLLNHRRKTSFCRDCHGDLHTGNIFLLDTPQPFDCIEFNDDYRHIDVLSEAAFLCMDLEFYGRPDLSRLFIDSYNRAFPTIASNEDDNLFIYFKGFRANIRAKVNSIRARSAGHGTEKSQAIARAVAYLRQMDGYLASLQNK